MQLEHSFSVPVGVDEAWKILLDIERVGACMPGARIDSIEGDHFTGTVKVKLGPINLTYKGQASFVEKDELVRRAVIEAHGREARGNGTAEARVTATLADAGGTTDVKVNTELDITGKPAQFGRGVMVDVGNKLLGQFADELARTIHGEPAAQPEAPAAQPETQAEPVPVPAAQPQAASEDPETPPVQASAPQPEPAQQSEPEQAAVDVPVAAVDEPLDEPVAAVDTPVAAIDEPAGAVDEPVHVEEVAPGAGGTPSYSVPGGVPAEAPEAAALVNGHAESDEPEPQDDVEPINLLRQAAPAVGKRLAPVAVALVIVLIAVRRRRRNRGRR